MCVYGRETGDGQLNYLEVGQSATSVDWRNITGSSGEHRGPRDWEMKKKPPVLIRKARDNSPSFVDNPDVPPLE